VRAAYAAESSACDSHSLSQRKYIRRQKSETRGEKAGRHGQLIGPLEAVSVRRKKKKGPSIVNLRRGN